MPSRESIFILVFFFNIILFINVWRAGRPRCEGAGGARRESGVRGQASMMGRPTCASWWMNGT